MDLGTYINAANQQFEEILDEDLWEDGELGAIDVSQKLFQRIVNTGEWKIIKEIK